MTLYEQVIDRFVYNKKTGEFVWKNPPKNHPRLKGFFAGTIRSWNGYKRVYIKINGKAYPRSRLAMLYVTKTIPTIVDHINGNTLDDRIVNLRNVSQSQNVWNRDPRSFKKKSTTPTGIRELKTCYQYRIRKNGITYRETFKTIEEASSALDSKRIELYGEYFTRRFL